MPTGEDKPGTHPEDGESEPTGEDKPGTHPEDGESEPTGEDKLGTHSESGESEPTGEDKKSRLWMETRWPHRVVGLGGGRKLLL